MTTATMTTEENSPTIVQSPVLVAADKNTEPSQNLHRSSTVASPERPDRRNRHSKRLSLNFPILIPSPQEGVYTNGNTPLMNQSPTSASLYRNGTPTIPFPLPSPDESIEHDPTSVGPDFLTLIAGQERRVMELKEELYKAETFLTNLKRQWASFEARKTDELRTKNVKLGPVSPNPATANGEDEQAERDRKREAREKRLRDLGMTEDDLERSNSNKGKRNGQRVLAGRHTRTLSLLQNNPAVVEAAQNAVASKAKMDSPPMNFDFDGTISSPIYTESTDPDRKRPSRLSMSRQSTLQDLVATSAQAAAQLNLGKTYKELASAGRKSLPPGTDLLVKQGRQVYDGVSQGFWSFVDDIRQATVGDEPVNGPPPVPPKEVKKTKGIKKNGEANPDKTGNKKNKTGDNHKPEKDIFWKEFGIETPKPNRKVSAKAARQASATKEEKENAAPIKDHESKSSTDSKHPPSLLADLMDVNDDDEAWDNWPADSPMTQKRRDQQVKIRAPSDDSDSEDIAKIRSRHRRNYTTKKGSISATWGRSHELD